MALIKFQEQNALSLFYGAFLWGHIVCFCMILIIVPDLAMAQNISASALEDKSRAPSQRHPEDLRAPALVYKGFTYRPYLSVETRYDSNILRRENDTLSDYIVATRPGVEISKDIGRHRFAIRAEGNIERFTTRAEENKEEFSLELNGRIEANSRWSAPFRLTRINRQRSRDEPTDQALSTKPLDVDIFAAQLGIRRQFNRLSLTLQGNYQDIEFENGDGNDNSAFVVFSDNNRRDIGVMVRAQYDIARPVSLSGDQSRHNLNRIEHSVFAELSAERSLFDRREFESGSFSGNSGSGHEIGALIGLTSQYKGLINGRIGLGYFQQSFDDPGLDDIRNLDFSADIAYHFRPKTTLRFEAERFVDQDNGFTSGVTRSKFILGADHELLHNLYLEGDLEYEDFEFEGIERDDDDIFARLRLRFLNSQNLESGFEAAFGQRSSSIPENEFDRFIFMLRLSGSL